MSIDDKTDRDMLINALYYSRELFSIKELMAMTTDRLWSEYRRAFYSAEDWERSRH